MENSCKDCKDRYPGCHAVCDKYANYKERQEERRKRMLKEKLFADLLRRRK